MKIIFLILLLPFDFYAQNVDLSYKTIKVTGQAQINLVPTSYSVSIQIFEIVERVQNTSNAEIVIDLDSLEGLLIDRLKISGYNPKKLKEIYINSRGQSYNSSNTNILLYKNFEYELKTISEVNTFLKKIRFQGLTGMNVRKIFNLNSSEVELKLYTEALLDAKTKAAKYLAAYDKTLGEVLTIDVSSARGLSINDEINNGWLGNPVATESTSNKSFTANVYVTFEIK